MRYAWTMAALALLGVAAHAGARATETPAFDWLSGCWQQVHGADWTEECWTTPRGDMLMGSGRSGSGAHVKEWEAMQILPGADGVPIFWGAVAGGKRVPFRQIERSRTGVTFANPTHDFPQRIRYWREGAALLAEVSMADGTKPVRWRYAAMK